MGINNDGEEESEEDVTRRITKDRDDCWWSSPFAELPG